MSHPHIRLALLVVALSGCSPLPPLQHNVCGNHVVEDQEDCDSDPGCIPNGEPYACHMRCSYYDGGICPRGKICVESHGTSACVATDKVCGNRVREAGEDCDGDPGCIPAGEPNACHMRCSAFAGGICPAGKVCTDGSGNGACLDKLNVCGNQVVEAGEECDDVGKGCGQPASSTPCRLICDPANAVACPDRYVCGNDRLCRKPLGTFTLGPAIGQTKNVQMADFNGDGAPDVVDRALGRLDMWRNDGHGHFALEASGGTPTQFGDDPVFFNRTAFAPAGAPMPLLAVNTPRGSGGPDYRVDLYTWRDGKLIPVVVPSISLPWDKPLELAAGSENSAVLLDRARGQLVTFSTAPYDFPWSPPTGSAAASCPLDPARPSAKATRIDSDGNLMYALVGSSLAGDLVACVNGQPLKSAGIQVGTRKEIGAAFGDLDNNGLLDLTVIVGVTTGQAGAQDQITWLQTKSGFLDPQVAWQEGVFYEFQDLYLDPVGMDQGLADFDGDGREDFAYGFVALKNLSLGTETSWGPSYPFYRQYRYDLHDMPSVATGDFNGDRHNDFLMWTADGRLLTAFGDGTFRFTIAGGNAGVALDDVRAGDINGDGKDDLVLIERAGTSTSLGIALGGAVAPTSPLAGAAVPLDGTTVQKVMMAPPPKGAIAKQVLAAMSTNSGAQGIAIGRADVTGQLLFSYPFHAYNVAFGDYDGDGKLDLAVIDLRTVMAGPVTGYGQVTVLRDMLPFSVSTYQVPFAASYEYPFVGADDLEFCALDPVGPPAVCGLSDHDYVARWNGKSYDVQEVQLDDTVAWAQQLVLDLDGDGRNELVQQIGFLSRTQCTVRVWHRADSGPFTITDSQLEHCEPLAFVDLPPLDGRLDLVATTRTATAVTQSYFVQRADFTFAAAPAGVALEISDANGPALNALQWIANADFNGDHINDLLVTDARDGKAHVAFADVAPPGQRPGP
jgi:hypothetical protein